MSQTPDLNEVTDIEDADTLVLYKSGNTSRLRSITWANMLLGIPAAAFQLFNDKMPALGGKLNLNGFAIRSDAGVDQNTDLEGLADNWSITNILAGGAPGKKLINISYDDLNSDTVVDFGVDGLTARIKSVGTAIDPTDAINFGQASALVGAFGVLDSVDGVATVAANTDLQRTGLLTPFGDQSVNMDVGGGSFAIVGNYLWTFEGSSGAGDYAKLKKFQQTYNNTWEYTGINLDISAQFDFANDISGSMCADSGGNLWLCVQKAATEVIYKYIQAPSPNADTLVYSTVLDVTAQGAVTTRGMALDGSGNFWIKQGSSSNKTIYKYTPSGATFVYASISFVLTDYDAQISDITVDSAGNLWASHRHSYVAPFIQWELVKYTVSGNTWIDANDTINATQSNLTSSSNLTVKGTQVLMFQSATPYQNTIEYFDIPAKTVEMTNIGKMLGAGDSADAAGTALTDCVSIDDDTIGCTTTLATGTHTITRDMLKGDKVEYYDSVTNVWRTPIKY